jgi:ATP-dependent protease HslVU (ClpYQ) peptidase subunit
MTLCVAALCEQGNPQGAKVVCAVDGMLSHIVSADVNAPKMLFVGDWIFMFAGQLSNADLMMDAIRPVQFSPQEVKTLVRRAYRKRMAQWSVDRYLLQYEMDMEEFKTDGRNIFGEERFAELSRSIEQDSVNYQEQVLVVGWATSKTQPIFFGMDREGLASHALDGIAAIGSGADVAMSTMLVLGQNRGMTLEDTLYSVASAKFAAERCEGVGQTTTMFVSWKRTETDPEKSRSGNFVHPPQMDEIRKVWDRYGKPRIPQQGWNLLSTIAVGLYEGRGRQVGVQHILKETKANKRRRKTGQSASQKSERAK